MENLKNIKLTSAKVEVEYTGTDEEGNTVALVESFEPDPAWTALLMRYLRHNQAVGQHGMGSMKISMEGSVGEYPKVAENRWHPSQSFNG